METRELTDGTLLVSHDSSGWTRWIVCFGVVLAGAAVWSVVAGPAHDARVVGLFGGAATLVLIGLACAESGTFSFDPTRKVIEWRRRRAWWRRAGTIAFDQVKDVVVERPIGDDGVPSRRICLRLADGTVLLIRAAYVPDGGDATLRLAERLRQLVGAQQRAPAPDAAAGAIDDGTREVRALVEQGRMVEAIKLLRVTKQLSLLDAKREADAMRAGGR